MGQGAEGRPPCRQDSPGQLCRPEPGGQGEDPGQGRVPLQAEQRPQVLIGRKGAQWDRMQGTLQEQDLPYHLCPQQLAVASFMQSRLQFCVCEEGPALQTARPRGPGDMKALPRSGRRWRCGGSRVLCWSSWGGALGWRWVTGRAPPFLLRHPRPSIQGPSPGLPPGCITGPHPSGRLWNPASGPCCSGHMTPWGFRTSHPKCPNL